MSRTRTLLASMLVACGLLFLSASSATYAADDKVYTYSIQTAVPSASLYFQLLEKFVKQVETMSGGRLKGEVLPAGAVVGPFEILDAVSNNVVKAGYAWGNYWSGKNSAFVLFANAPASTGLDQSSLVAWYYRGGGEKLYEDFLQGHHASQLEGVLHSAHGSRPARLVQEADQEHAGLHQVQVPLASGHPRRDLQEHGRCRGRDAGRRHRSGGPARRDRRGGMDRPRRRPQSRPAEDLEVLLSPGPAPADRRRPDHLQQGLLELAARRPAGNHQGRGDGQRGGNLHGQHLRQLGRAEGAADEVRRACRGHAEGLLSEVHRGREEGDRGLRRQEPGLQEGPGVRRSRSRKRSIPIACASSNSTTTW